MAADDEISTVDLKAISEIAHAHGTVFDRTPCHCRGVRINVQEMGIICSPFPVTNSIARESVLLSAQGHRTNRWFMAAGQERGLSSGTENVAGIVGLGQAIEDATRSNLDEKLGYVKKLTDRLAKGIMDKMSCPLYR